jgi:hypothetical protein
MLALGTFCSKTVIDRLRRHRLAQAERFLSAGAGRPDEDTLIFENDGQPWVPTTFGMLYARFRDDAKLPKGHVPRLKAQLCELARPQWHRFQGD